MLLCPAGLIMFSNKAYYKIWNYVQDAINKWIWVRFWKYKITYLFNSTYEMIIVDMFVTSSATPLLYQETHM